MYVCIKKGCKLITQFSSKSSLSPRLICVSVYQTQKGLLDPCNHVGDFEHGMTRPEPCAHGIVSCRDTTETAYRQPDRTDRTRARAERACECQSRDGNVAELRARGPSLGRFSQGRGVESGALFCCTLCRVIKEWDQHFVHAPGRPLKSRPNLQTG